MILVTTPSGDIGGRVLGHLLDAGREVRAVARRPETVAADIEIVKGSHADPKVITEALDGVEAVFWLPPGDVTLADAKAAYVGFSDGLCAALPTSSVTHVVGVSALGRGWRGPAGHVGASVEMDDRIAATGVAYRALACASLMNNLMRQLGPLKGSAHDTGAFYQPMPGDLASPLVAKADVAAVAVGLLLDRDWEGAADIPLLGPEDLSPDEMAATLSEVLSRDVAFREMSMDAFANMLRGQGASEGMTRAYVEMMTAKAAGLDAMHADADRSLTPTTFRNWCAAELRPALEASTGGDVQ